MKLLDTLLRDKWRTKLDKAANVYNRAMFLQNFAKGQILMPLGLVNEALWLLTYLAILGIRPTAKTIAITYVIALIFLVILGKVLVWLGWMKMIQKFGNEENEMQKKILENTEFIRKKLEHG